jgi:hypothetical protein
MRITILCLGANHRRIDEIALAKSTPGDSRATPTLIAIKGFSDVER